MAKIWPPQGDDSPSFAFKAPCCCIVHGPALDVFETRGTTQNGSGVCRCGCTFGGKNWKTRTWSGSLHMDAFESCDPGALPIGSSDEDFSGSMTFDPEVCYPAICTAFLCATGDLIQAGSSTGASCAPMAPNSPADATETANTQVYTGSGLCVLLGGNGAIVTGEATDAYSGEDTADDAIARMLAHAGASAEDGSDNWSNWASGDGSSFYATPGDPTGGDEGSCFGYLHGEWRIRRNHLLPSTSYTVSVEIWRAAWDGVTTPDPGDYSLFATQEVVAVTDGSGLLKTDPVVIPNAVGTVTTTKLSTLTVVPT